MVNQKIDGISFPMKEPHDFSFLSRFGRVFCVFATNDSGNISFGVSDGTNKYFIKVAGAKTAHACVSTQQAVQNLKAAIPLYMDLSHPHLIQLQESFDDGDLCVAVFKWAEGECLFDHWNFEMYEKSNILPPRKQFKKLSSEKKLKAFDAVFDFLAFAESKDYVAIDFYDGSILYDFERDIVMICDIDLFRKKPVVNEMGEDFWGTNRLKSPEEYLLGAEIDSITNVFTLGALLFHYFGEYTDAEMDRMYENHAFFPCRYEAWELNRPLYEVARKAVCPDRTNRFASIHAFYTAWNEKLSKDLTD